MKLNPDEAAEIAASILTVDDLIAVLAEYKSNLINVNLILAKFFAARVFISADH